MGGVQKRPFVEHLLTFQALAKWAIGILCLGRVVGTFPLIIFFWQAPPPHIAGSAGRYDEGHDQP